MKLSYKAHGKVILLGEHSVVYGYNALAMPIKSLWLKATIEPSTILWMDTALYHGPFLAAPAEYDGLKYVVTKLLAKTNSQQLIKITYTGKIPIERGLGSSATVATATVRALNDYWQLNLSEKEIIAMINHAEMINHGKASGIDAATVNSDNLIFFNKKNGALQLKSKLKASLLIMDTGDLGNTQKAVKQVHTIVANSIPARQNIKKLGNLTDQAKVAWVNQDKQQLGQIFNLAQDILHSFNLSTTKIDQIQDIALANGALGFKLSGSGLGGIVIALCANHEIAEKIADLSHKLIVNQWIEEI
ncbi:MULTISPECIES: mevalonate kinase [unclassified Lactobacillus]|uniref:mevalonate kinase n=1 Tax=unclassified Lactobacillus TaxID=2620435 RepID=UPI000EFB6796|nr:MULTISPECIES: mevalonate kinase [unclassified Lactobacillus]RMC40046.1 mevalonate kinase [Lactobacillus sp. ESL0237]RMC44124.1 mevalonate kinase [Lactobacillus sp. ESL0234]RMC45537.1 mevalonate kinase [Lactobacillus sp. ESL0236]RMC46846.1 mevalonate kinase [Lactobacillus sp. ESL0230]